MDWSSCIICGSRKGEPLKCTVDSPHKDCEQVYKAFLQNVEQFKEFDALPVNLTIGQEVSFELLGLCEQGSKRHLRRICCHKQRL